MTVDSFDADVLIYACIPGHPLGKNVRTLFDEARSDFRPVGSVMLKPELLVKPMRRRSNTELEQLVALLGRLDLWPVDDGIVDTAVAVAAKYGLRAVDAVHLATAAELGADRFITSNRKDFPQTITEVDVAYLDAL